MLREDFVLRAVQQLAGALARIAGLRREEKQEEALAAVAEGKACLPLVPGMVDQMSIEGLKELLADPDLLEQLGLLYQQEAELCYQMGQQDRALRCLVRAKALLGEDDRKLTHGHES